MKIHKAVQKWGMHRQTGDLISLLSVVKSRLKTQIYIKEKDFYICDVI
jgi:hypothetical protein